ncbi:hypothetical protein OEA41_005696 [Lepraria neglecta]|uniref:Uncharacterized protein n=1 Tax=Lepraria neglecta TaxID=209136 RepID=A0AAE0DKA9_9LECA|nr:hypothetical protein OEA41_005696 [Lepraria neglecta]
MLSKTSLTAAAIALTSSAAAQTLTLNVSGTPSYLDSVLAGYTTLSYANNTIYIGQVKNQLYSEELVLSSVGGYGLAFQSYHLPAGELQTVYINPNVTAPVFFTDPGADVPSGVDSQGFSFDNAANRLTNGGENNFMFCQDLAESELNSWRLWWEGDGIANGVSCLVGVDLIKVVECED